MSLIISIVLTIVCVSCTYYYATLNQPGIVGLWALGTAAWGANAGFDIAKRLSKRWR